MGPGRPRRRRTRALTTAEPAATPVDLGAMAEMPGFTLRSEVVEVAVVRPADAP